MEERESLIRALLRNEWLPKNIRKKISLEQDFTIKNTEWKKHCLYTKRRRGLITKYGVGRHSFQRLVNHGWISGVSRARW